MLLRKAGDSAWHAPAVTAYDNEQALQSLLERSPDLLPGSSGQAMAVVSELPVAGVGSADLAAVDPARLVTIIECKLRANPDIRRQVVGQVFAYAAGLWGHSYEAFDQAFASRAGATLAECVAHLGAEGWDEESFRAAVAENLTRGRFRLVIAVDEITEELMRVVLYLNEHTSPDLQVLALELRYVADHGMEILFPTVYGGQSSTPKAVAQEWNEVTVFAALARFCSPDGLEAARRLYNFAKKSGAAFNWGVASLPSLTARLTVLGKPISAFTIYEWPRSVGVFVINFEYLANAGVPGEAIQRVAELLRRIPGVPERYADLEAKHFQKRPPLGLDSIVAQTGAVETIEAALDELIPSRPVEL